MMNNKNTAKKMSINENAILEKYLNTLATPISKHKPDKKLSFIWANDAFYKMTGHEKKDFKINLKGTSALCNIMEIEPHSTFTKTYTKMASSYEWIFGFRKLCVTYGV